MQPVQKPARTAAAPAPKAETVFGKNTTLEGVTALISSDEKKIVLSAQNQVLTIEGEQMTVDSLDTDAGTASVSGDIKSIRVSATRDVKGLFSKLLK